jgi:L-ribulose-5-phosphate 4-epimerase
VAHDEQRQKVVWACNELVRLGLVAGTAGNVTVRIPGTDLIAASPSSVRYDLLTAADVCIVDVVVGDLVEGFRNPTSELLMHLAVHRARAGDVGAVIHAHSVGATAVSLLGRGIPPIVDEQVAILGGEVPLCPHRLPGSAALAECVVEHLADLRALILSHHGMLGVGRDVHQAVAVCHLTERLADVLLRMLPLGEPRPLPAEAQELERAYYEMSTRPPRPLFSA